ncbi:MAG TPA: PAS domain-containing protein [Myxococcota bacterium]|nr:PAS domain-containing protein [Myxococcota bacterium]
MSQSAPLVRIIVAQPRHRLGSPGPLGGTARVLEHLGREMDIAIVHDAETCLARAAGAPTDLVVLDAGLEAEGDRILEALRASGPPVVVVTDRPEDERIHAAFRNGAADCVAAGQDYARVLPIVALEQIRRWRETVERGQVEQRLRDLERLGDAIVEAIPAPIAVLSAEGRVVSANPEFARAFGVSLDAVAGKPLEHLVPEELYESGVLRLLIASAARAGGGNGVDRGTVGRTRRFDVRVRRLGEGGGLLVVLWDVTERDQLAKRLADLTRYNENVIQNLNSALIVVDRAGAITFANQAAEGVFAAEPGTLRGQLLWDWFPGTSPEKLLVARTLTEGVRHRNAETVITRRDGSLLPIGVSCAPLTDAAGERIGAVAIFEDLSELKELQRAVLQNEKMASIGQLAAGVAHEINNPMGFIHANLCQMTEYLTDVRRVWDEVVRLQESIAGGSLGEIRRQSLGLSQLVRQLDVEYLVGDFAKALRESQEGSERIRHIVQDLRSFSRHDPGERTLADLNECLDSTASIAWAMMKHSVVLRKEYRDVPRVRCYPMQLKQVFMNLLVNAYQAIQERFAQSGEIGEIRLQTAERHGGVTVTVTDNGIGIRPEHVNRIFDPFFTTKEVGIGTGLGLSTSFSIVQRHGGTLKVESKPGEGSSFELFLPLAAGDETGPADGGTSAAGGAGRA